MASPMNQSWIFSSCSLLMASLFAASASVQLNDPDWYFWFPLYSCASAVNLIAIIFPSKPRSQLMAKMTFGLGIFLFFKVVTEDVQQGMAGFWSLDLSKRVVREKTGSGFVVTSMFLQLKALSNLNYPIRKRDQRWYLDYGMALLVGASFGLFFVFLFVNGGLKL